jgi:hypothetical protein
MVTKLIKNKITLSSLICLLFIAGCQSTEQNASKPTGEYKWEHKELYSALDRGEVKRADVENQFYQLNSKCENESLKVSIPSPSCTQPPKQSCAGLTGFSLGFCQGYVPPPVCDYSSVNAAYSAQSRVYDNCMTLGGWAKTWVPYDKDGNPILTNDKSSRNNDTKNDVLESAIEAVPELADWRENDKDKWKLAIAIDDELRNKPEYENMLLVERFQVVVNKVKSMSSGVK